MIKGRIGTLKSIMTKWLQGLLELITFFPILLTVGILLIPKEIWIWMVDLSAIYLIGLILGGYLLKKPRYIHFFVGILINSLSAFLLFGNLYAMILFFLSGMVIFDRGVRFRGTKWGDMFPNMALWIGLTLYLLGGSIYSLTPALKPYFKLLAWTGFVYTIIVLFVINTEQLKTASQPVDGTVPIFSSTVLRNNRILILLSIALVMFISYFNDLKDGCVWLARKVGQGFLAIILFLPNLLGTPGPGMGGLPGQGPMEIIPDIEATEPSMFAVVLEKALMFLAAAAFLVLLWFALRVVFRLLKKAYRRLLEFLKGFVLFQESGGFIDEKERLIGLKDIGRDYRNKFQDWLKGILEKEPKWDELQNNHQRIRFLYRNLLLRCLSGGYTHKNYLTPRETAADILDWDENESPEIADLSQAYDETRYGEKKIEDSRVRGLAEKFLRKQR